MLEALNAWRITGGVSQQVGNITLHKQLLDNPFGSSKIAIAAVGFCMGYSNNVNFFIYYTFISEKLHLSYISYLR